MSSKSPTFIQFNDHEKFIYLKSCKDRQILAWFGKFLYKSFYIRNTKCHGSRIPSEQWSESRQQQVHKELPFYSFFNNYVTFNGNCILCLCFITTVTDSHNCYEMTQGVIQLCRKSRHYLQYMYIYKHLFLKVLAFMDTRTILLLLLQCLHFCLFYEMTVLKSLYDICYCLYHAWSLLWWM